MSETTGAPDSAETRGDAVPDVTRIPLSQLEPAENPVLEAAIRRLVDEVTDGREVTAQFGNSP
ncbi:FXSXX-COOH protein [Actinoplanes sp. LDG1-06]|uniref:FXSXX-COOH protein n=1 Tax=Paractinoplanes ovalisporus TaxID=2810368 RepID=A0ABS2A7C4_9ACTN|nr:FxSxx-COOH cyclophane-containing RiPP peptide [Actinoplanes ovalisporus]MBM2615742.1 FXSXX-COOH protein [Actinoplanes ovalisporus]